METNNRVNRKLYRVLKHTVKKDQKPTIRNMYRKDSTHIIETRNNIRIERAFRRNFKERATRPLKS